MCVADTVNIFKSNVKAALDALDDQEFCRNVVSSCVLSRRIVLSLSQQYRPDEALEDKVSDAFEQAAAQIEESSSNWAFTGSDEQTIGEVVENLRLRAARLRKMPSNAA